MHKSIGWLCGVTGGARAERARMPLQLNELDRIICFPARGDGMRAIVTGLTVETPMTGRLTIKRLSGSITRTMAASVTTLWFAEPWALVLRHHGDITMAVDTTHSKVL